MAAWTPIDLNIYRMRGLRRAAVAAWTPIDLNIYRMRGLRRAVPCWEWTSLDTH
ncbi:hypothetical protein [Steroidobacter agaridevorans]|uniref:hypothetical protein n=1 Tax=Steroidobacter agaridevorans TaxID=2695856 RepID=UPI00137AC019|nr:hypothetical protein [Steroidobacter agaridevorans]